MNNGVKRLLACLLAAVLTLSLGILPAGAESTEQIQTQIDALQEQEQALQARMEELEQQRSDNAARMEELLAEKRRIDAQVFLLYVQTENINSQIASYTSLIADKQEQLDGAKAAYGELSDKYRDRVRTMEEAGELSYWSVLFKAKSFEELLDRMSMIEEIAAADRKRLEELDAAAQAVSDAQAELQAGKEALEQKRADLEEAQQKLDEKSAETDELLARLIALGDEYTRYLEQAEAEQNGIMQQLAQKRDEYDAAAYAEYLASYAPPAGGGPLEPETGTQSPSESETGEAEESGSERVQWLYPLPYRVPVTSPYGMRIHPTTGGDDWRMHAGVDLGADTMTPIYAVRGGLVSSASENDSCGYYVSINHGDGYSSIYMHMTYFTVGAGEYVAPGQVIGYVGDTGDTTGPHLHLGIFYDGVSVNPMDYI